MSMVKFHLRCLVFGGACTYSLSQLVRWLGGKAEELGTEIYPGFSASEVISCSLLVFLFLKPFDVLHRDLSFQVLYDASDKVVGIATKDMGISKDGSKKENFQPGVDIKGLCLVLSLSFIFYRLLLY